MAIIDAMWGILKWNAPLESYKKENQSLHRTNQCCQETCHQPNVEEKGEKDGGNPVWLHVLSQNKTQSLVINSYRAEMGAN